MDVNSDRVALYIHLPCVIVNGGACDIADSGGVWGDEQCSSGNGHFDFCSRLRYVSLPEPIVPPLILFEALGPLVSNSVIVIAHSLTSLILLPNHSSSVQ
jgi:hypothetical protein